MKKSILILAAAVLGMGTACGNREYFVCNDEKINGVVTRAAHAGPNRVRFISTEDIPGGNLQTEFNRRLDNSDFKSNRLEAKRFCEAGVLPQVLLSR